MKGGKGGHGRQRPPAPKSSGDTPRGSGRKKGDPKRDWGAQPNDGDKPRPMRPAPLRKRPTG